MSKIIKKFPIGSCEGQAGRLDVYILVETDAIDYVSATRDYYISLIFNVESEDECSLRGNLSGFSCFGASVSISGNKTLRNGENVLKGFVRQSVSGDAASYSLTLEHSCEELGLTDPINISGTLSLYPLYTSPAVNVAGESRLGKDILLSGDFLDVGYDVVARVVIDGVTVGEEWITKDKKYIQTSLDWIVSHPNEKVLAAQVVIEASFNGEVLPENRILPVDLVLSAEDGAPSVVAEHIFKSDVGVIEALGIAVKGKSSALLRVTDACARLGAGITSVQIGMSGQLQSGETCESEVLDVAREYTYQARVTDTRGFTGVYNGTFEVQDYFPPKFSAVVKRTDLQGIEDKRGTCVLVEAVLEGYCSFSGENQCSFYFTVCKTGEAEGTQIPIQIGDQTLLDAGLDSGATYEIRVVCSDTFGGTSSKIYYLEKENIELNIAKNKVGIGKYAENEGLFDCAWPIRCSQDVYVIGSDGTERSLLSLCNNVLVCDVSDEQSFAQLATPEDGTAKLILMYLEDSFFGYSKGYHLFFVFNHRGSGGNYEIKFS